MRAYKYEELETNSLRYNLAVNSSLFLDEDFGGESLAIFDSLSKRLFFNFSCVCFVSGVGYTRFSGVLYIRLPVAGNVSVLLFEKERSFI